MDAHPVTASGFWMFCRKGCKFSNKYIGAVMCGIPPRRGTILRIIAECEGDALITKRKVLERRMNYVLSKWLVYVMHACCAGSIAETWMAPLTGGKGS